MMKMRTKSGLYNYNTPIIKDNCYQTNARIINQKVGVSMHKNAKWRFYAGPVDIESKLKNLNITASKNPESQYNPLKDECRNSKNCLVDLPDCHLKTDDTRLSNPNCNLRGININRFTPLCMNPQKNIFFPGQKCISTRIMEKDNYKQKYQLLK